MSFKLIGGAIILLLAAALADGLNKKEEAKSAQIKAITALLKFFRTQIDLYCAPVGEIFHRADEKLLSDCACKKTPENFDDFILSLERDPGERTREVLSSFAAELGSSYKEEQLKSIDHHISQMAEISAVASEETKKKKKLCTALCLSAAALIVILLI